MPNNVEGFFERYREALADGDVDALCAAYRLPLPVVRPDRFRVVDDPVVMRSEMQRIVDTWKWAGMTSVAMSDFRTDGFEPGMHVVSLVWRPLDDQFEEIARVDVTYVVRRVAEAARIAAILAHNEERKREPLIRPKGGWAPFVADDELKRA